MHKSDVGQTFLPLFPGEQEFVLTALIRIREAAHVLLAVVALPAQEALRQQARTPAQFVQFINRRRVIFQGFYKFLVGLPAEPRVYKRIIGINGAFT